MLLGGLLIYVVRDVKLHVLVKRTEAVAKRSIFDAFFVSDYEIVQGFETWDAVDDVMPVTRDRTDRVGVKSDVENGRKCNERLEVLPLRNVVVMQIKELEFGEAAKDLGGWQGLKLVVRQVELLKVREISQVVQVFFVEHVVLQVQDGKILAPAQELEGLRDLLAAEGDDSDLFERFTVSVFQQNLWVVNDHLF